VILQPHSGAAGAAHLAERIINAFARPFDVDGQMVEITCSVGITLISDPETSASELLRQADLALYSSKEKGRNCACFFEPEMDAALRLRCKLEADLRLALDDEALHMVYQPQVDPQGQIVGVEALVRWDHPERGAIPPYSFVVLAEECGLIAQLGEYIVRRVFAETAHLCDLPVAINVSALQLRMPAFMAAVKRMAAEFAIETTNYEFEITETVLLGEDAATRDTIAALKAEGFAIALDDFGTGYSSLSSLQRFKVDRIKIDRAFVRNLDSNLDSGLDSGLDSSRGDENREAVTLIDAIIKLARALDLEVIAEGVETIGQRDRLLACGCDRFQGYLYARPMPAQDLLALLAAGGRTGPSQRPVEQPPASLHLAASDGMAQ
jgi:EAL domain-containing protein (putative c-di-GMP-specific phosphodiesterase class I)